MYNALEEILNKKNRKGGHQDIVKKNGKLNNSNSRLLHIPIQRQEPIMRWKVEAITDGSSVLPQSFSQFWYYGLDQIILIPALRAGGFESDTCIN